MTLGSTTNNRWVISESTIDLSRGAKDAVFIAARGKNLVLDLGATALIVVDMQNRFCRPRSAGDRPPAMNCVAPLQALLPFLRKRRVPVLWLNWGNRADKLNLAPGVIYPFHRDGGPLPVILDKGSEDARIIDALTVDPADIHVDKYRLSGFWDTPLDSILRNLRIQTLLFAGVNLDQCVYATLLDASCLGYDCILVEDCAATRSPEFCTEATLYNVERGLGFVTRAQAICAASSR